MTQSDFDFDDNAPFDPDFVKEAKSSILDMGRTMVTGKMEESKLLEESALDGGPSSVGEAIYCLMQELNVGIRALSAKVNVKRKVLMRMLEGEIPLPPEVMTKITNHFKDISLRQGKNLPF